jgi:hypothetical protein
MYSTVAAGDVELSSSSSSISDSSSGPELGSST